ncbi:hypothetical protein HPB50_000417 [Hyalomma asiaticum]|uniref:Uncharacterized protein n=1 Tax=Hyalomma asiaticum TaxID=266040 RepID=A0ACB7RR09_HYAAI|nr:hypothetical protein HPB50_000417 [Hyalomma asiaticum]
MQRQSASLVRPWILALAVACAIYPDYARGQFLKRFRSCTLPHERRAWMWQRTEQYCRAGRTLEYRRRSQPCVCQTGYYRDEETNNCYDARRCGQCDSSKHERFNSCTNDCEPVCGKQVIQQCDKPCVPGCECKKGYIRKYKKGPCVPIQTCPPKCPAYMTFEMERERCPRICNMAREDGCSETNEGPGCACKKGFVLRAPFGTVRTRVWCIHESMCTFPDEVKGPARNQVRKGGQSFKTNGAATNDRFWAPSRGRHGLQEPVPKRYDDDLFFDGKGFPPLGNLANKGGQGSELGQTKLGLDDGEISQGKVALGNDKTWRWERGQRAYQGSLPQKIDDDLFQDNKGYPPLGGLVQKKDQEFNFGQEGLASKAAEGVTVPELLARTVHGDGTTALEARKVPRLKKVTKTCILVQISFLISDTEDINLSKALNLAKEKWDSAVAITTAMWAIQKANINSSFKGLL